MKKKYLNLLIVMFTFCLMFINMEEVKADVFARCDYSGKKTSEFKFTLEFDNEGRYDAQKVYENAFKSFDFYGGKAGEVPSPFGNDGGIIYCPKTIYLGYVTSEDKYYSLVTNYRWNFEVLGQMVSTPNTELTLSGFTGNALEYEAQKDSQNNIVICETTGDKKGEELLEKYDGYHSALILYDRGHSPSKENLKKLNKNYSDLYSEVEAASQFNYCNKTKIDDLYITKLSADMQILEDVNSRNQNISDKDKKEMNDKIMDNKEKAQSYSNTKFYDSEKTYSCEGLISDDLEAVIQFALKVVRIAAPILLIILCVIDFSQVVISGDQDALKKATSKVVKRAIAALALFLVPFFVSLAIEWVDDSEYFNKDAAKCTEVLE